MIVSYLPLFLNVDLNQNQFTHLSGSPATFHLQDYSGPDYPEDYWEAGVNCFKKQKLKESDAIKQARLAWILKDGDYNFETGSVKLWEPNLIQV